MGKARGLPQLRKLLMQIQATDKKGQFGAQRLEEAENVIIGLGNRIGSKVETPVFQF